MSRNVFRYNWSQRFFADIKRRARCVICCNFNICCCRSKKVRILGPNKDDRLYAEGLTKLYTEIDLLEVVKQLRISRFMSSIFLSHNQRELIKFQKDYALGLRKRRLNRSGRISKRVASSAIHSQADFNGYHSVQPAP